MGDATRSRDVIDPDIDIRIGDQRAELASSHGAVLAVIAIGGGLGALARYAISEFMPVRVGQFPWSTFLINVSGCLLMGVLMVLITEVWSAHRLARPFLGTGVLGGFTTFSTYANEVHGFLRPGSLGTALEYSVGTVLGALLAVGVGVCLTRMITGRSGSQAT